MVNRIIDYDYYPRPETNLYQVGSDPELYAGLPSCQESEASIAANRDAALRRLARSNATHLAEMLGLTTP